ncbi:unnamed protein product [Toxocara canis]|uniref:RRM domain-containing protein n=1 Tax=Toxocara canis TaxID=6265 RepID=A0A183UX75_TOXCA|nr:unnamed protein product [Toxocara canis]
MKMVCDASLSYAPLSWFEIVIIKVAQDDASILAFVEFSSNDALMIMFLFEGFVSVFSANNWDTNCREATLSKKAMDSEPDARRNALWGKWGLRSIAR